jgi:glycosyltransferase involved in cell wall biosynthesis
MKVIRKILPLKKLERNKCKITIVMPAYNAEKTLYKTYNLIPKGSYDDIILVDDESNDNTVAVAKSIDGLKVLCHEKNLGYGGNQKTCYKEALENGSDIIVMLHPDYQYDPTIIPNITLPILEGQADVVFASRMLGDPILGGPCQGGMPIYKYFANKILTFIENKVLKTYFTEFHTGYRAFSGDSLNAINFANNSNSFVFDNEIIIQLLMKGAIFKEIPVVTKYHIDASSVDFKEGVIYGFNVLRTIVKYLLHVKLIKQYKMFS